MIINYKLQLELKHSSLKNCLISNISKCMTNAVQQKNMGSLKSKLTISVTNAIKKFESSNKASELFEMDAERFAFNIIPNRYFQDSDPEIERLERERSKLRIHLMTKEDELRNLSRRVSVTKSLTRNDAIKSLVANIIKKFKTLSKEKQLILVNDKALLALNVEKYIKNLIIFYDEEQKQFGVVFKKNYDVLDTLSTGNDIVILAINLSSKYVHLSTSAAYKAASVHYKICRKERNELKEQLSKISMQLQIVYAKQQNGSGFKGFGAGGGFSGGGASGGGSAHGNGW